MSSPAPLRHPVPTLPLTDATETLIPVAPWTEAEIAVHAIEPVPELPPPVFRQPRPAPQQAQTHVIHVAGRLGQRVSAFLHSATHTLAGAGVQQTLVLVDDPSPPHWINGAAPFLRVVPSPGASSRLRTWWSAMRTLRSALADLPHATVHLHGLLPSVFGARALSCAAFRSQVFYSLHGERALAPWSNLAAVPLWMLARQSRRPQVRVMSSTYVEDRPAPWLDHHALEFIEAPVAPVYFDVARHETRHPLIALGPRATHTGCADACAQLAVLMGGSDLRLSFNWLGPVDGEDAALLKAAHIGAFADLDDAQRASRLGAAWLYASLDTRPGFATDIAQAMAAGLPCVALDSRSHRDVVEQGLTGYLCRDRDELMARVAELLDDPALRLRMGMAARERARRRFTDQRFQRKLLRAYGFDQTAIA